MNGHIPGYNAAQNTPDAMTPVDSTTNGMPTLDDLAGGNAAVYPEVYYKLQPHILEACDRMDAYDVPPVREIMDSVADNVESNVMKSNPEVGALADNGGSPMPEAREAVSYGYGPGYGRRRDSGFRSRSFLRDLIEILLLQETYRRRRYPY